MTTWQELVDRDGHPPVWPYPVNYEQEQEIDTDVLVLGGGIAGCWAAIAAARTGVKVALVEKGAVIRSGQGGPGCDHWCNVPANPLSKVDPDEWAIKMTSGPYSNGIGTQIQCRENYDTIIELENMGAKIRDSEDRYAGAEGRDDKTKFMISPRYNQLHDTNVVIRVWGTTFKPALRKECLRLGVRIFDRVMATGLLTEGGAQGTRVIGSIGVNCRTGEFMVFKSKATVLAMSGARGNVWHFSSELAGIPGMGSRTMSGDGVAMAWKAGAEFTLMEKSEALRIATAYKHKWYMGAGDASYENVPLIDDNGKELPIVTEPGWGRIRQGYERGQRWEEIHQGILKGEYELPFYGDFPGMKDIERDVTWNLMLGEESTTRIIIDTLMESGFDPAKDYLWNYQFIEGGNNPQWRATRGAGLTVDWNLKSNLDGLYVGGTQMFSPGDHSHAAATGRYAGRKAADYARQIGETAISREQVEKAKARVYAPIERKDGIEWKELHVGIARTMQFFCSEYKNEKLLNMGLYYLKDIEDKYVPKLYARDPHKLMRSLEDLSTLTVAQMVLHASLARKASSRPLDFHRIDYPELDPPEWDKFVTIKMEDGKVKVGEKPFGYGGNLKENYEAHNKDYKGVYQA